MATSDRPPPEPNTRLRTMLAERNITMGELAAVTGCSIKTVQRWIYNGRTPHPRHAEKAARHLDIDPNWLWPRRRVPVNPELINLYPHIGAVPPQIWTLTAAEAKHTIDIATDVATGLPHDLAHTLHTRLAHGTAVRLCLGGDAVPTAHISGARIRINTTRPMIGIYRFDNQMLVWLNRSGSTLDCLAPVLHLRRRERGVFDHFLGLFEQWWHDSDARHDEEALPGA